MISGTSDTFELPQAIPYYILYINIIAAERKCFCVYMECFKLISASRVTLADHECVCLYRARCSQKKVILEEETSFFHVNSLPRPPQAPFLDLGMRNSTKTEYSPALYMSCNFII